jgi:hypothetical protein
MVQVPLAVIAALGVCAAPQPAGAGARFLARALFPAFDPAAGRERRGHLRLHLSGDGGLLNQLLALMRHQGKAWTMSADWALPVLDA